MSARRFLIASVLPLLLAAGPLLAGAWGQPNGGYFLKIAPTYLRATEEFDHRGDRQIMQAEIFASEDVAFIDFGLSAYLEYGVRDRFTLVAQLPGGGRTVVTPLPGGGGVVPELIVGDQHVTKLNPALAYSLRPGLALQIEALHVIAGTNSLAGTIYSFGILLTGN